MGKHPDKSENASSYGSCSIDVSNVRKSDPNIHWGKNLFKCKSCDHDCGQKIQLQQHVALVHEGKMPYKCESSDQDCDQKRNLNQCAASIHEGKKPFKVK